MEVPTVLTPTRIALQIAEQIVGIPVPRGCGEQRLQGLLLQGLLPGQGSTSVSSAHRISERTVEQIVDFPRGVLLGFSPGQGSTSVSSAECISERIMEQIVDIPRGGLPGFSPGQGSSSFSSAERISERIVEQLVDISCGGLSPGVFSASSAGAADEGPAGRGSGMGKAHFAGEVAPRALSSRGKAGFAGEDAPRGSFSRGKAGSTGEDAPRGSFSRGKAGSTGDDAPRGSSSLPRACEPRLGGLPAQGRHDEWVCVVDVENDGEYFWNRLDNSTCWRLPRGVEHRWCLLPSGLYRDVVTQVDFRVLLPL